MPRPRKWRRICAEPRYTRFSPISEFDKSTVVDITVDEYETIHLIDLEGYSQEQCAKQMGVARTTVQAIYQSARIKLALGIVHGRSLVINGGEYKVCEYSGACCSHGYASCAHNKGSMCQAARQWQIVDAEGVEGAGE